MKHIITLLLITLSFYQVKAQKTIYGPTIGYQNQSGNFGKIGFFLIGESGDGLLKADVNLNLAGMRNEFVTIPELGIAYYQPFFSPLYFMNFYELEITPYTLTPKIGLSFFSFFDLGLGYGFSFNEKNNFKPIKGFTTSIGISIPLNKKL